MSKSQEIITAFEELTLQMIEEATRIGIHTLNPETIKEIRECAQAVVKIKRGC